MYSHWPSCSHTDSSAGLWQTLWRHVDGANSINNLQNDKQVNIVQPLTVPLTMLMLCSHYYDSWQD